MAKVGNSAMGYAYKRMVAVNPMCPSRLLLCSMSSVHVVLSILSREKHD